MNKFLVPNGLILLHRWMCTAMTVRGVALSDSMLWACDVIIATAITPGDWPSIEEIGSRPQRSTATWWCKRWRQCDSRTCTHHNTAAWLRGRSAEGNVIAIAILA